MNKPWVKLQLISNFEKEKDKVTHQIEGLARKKKRN